MDYNFIETSAVLEQYNLLIEFGSKKHKKKYIEQYNKIAIKVGLPKYLD
tara:strand:- start:88 stop:234 length:147 start_codon:yes stop_codon:yes gene_type:complete